MNCTEHHIKSEDFYLNASIAYCAINVEINDLNYPNALWNNIICIIQYNKGNERYYWSRSEKLISQMPRIIAFFCDAFMG